MGDLEFFRLDKDGAGWEGIEKAPKEVLDKLAKGLHSPEQAKMLCFICHKETKSTKMQKVPYIEIKNCF